MMRILSTALQTILLFFVFAAGSIFWHPFNLQTALAGTAQATRVFVWDGMLLMLLTFAFILAVEAARKRLRHSAPWSTLALALATLLGLASKLGFITRDF